MAISNKQVRDLCLALMVQKVQAIWVTDEMIGDNGFSISTAPLFIAFISYRLLDDLKRDMGIASEVKLTKLKGRNIKYLTPRRPTYISGGVLPSVTREVVYG